MRQCCWRQTDRGVPCYCKITHSTPPLPSAMSPTVLGKVVHDHPLSVGNDSTSLRVIILHHAPPSTVRMHPQWSREGEWTVRRVTHRTHMDEDRRIGQAKVKKKQQP